MSHNPDFEALGTLVLALEKIASMDLRETPEFATSVDLGSFMEELRIVVEPALVEADTKVHWEVPLTLPIVWADRHSLMQVFLNLTKNSERAMEKSATPCMRVVARAEQQRVVISVSDNGGGVRNPEQLFKPFQHLAQATGLGLYLSRALMRSFGGELRYQPINTGATFIVEVATIVETTGVGNGIEDQIAAN